MRILGVDPGINITGYGCITIKDRTVHLDEAGVIKPKKSQDLSLRLMDLYRNFDDILKEFDPDVVTVEEVFTHLKFPKTAITMGHARGVILLAAALNEIEIVDYAATRIKKALTGNGHASKEQIQMMVKQILELNQIPSPPDVADALAVALCHANMNFLF
ncbi:MAG: crossover junction endodeoxyribonuclease RuvC [bacterium]|nr:crossover junction endodeoxyribonuclease RuvC [bacterium]